VSAAAVTAPRADDLWTLAWAAPAIVTVATSAAWLPALTLPLVAVGAVIVVALFRLDLALLLFAAAVPLEYSVTLSGNPQLTVVKLAGGLCFASFAVQLAARRIRLRLDSTHLMLLGILSLLLVATVAAQRLDSAPQVAVRYLSYIALYFVLTSFAGDHRTLERFVWVLSLASAAAGALAIRNLLIGFDTRATPTYGDANDLAYMLSTTLPLTLWLLGRRGPRRFAVILLVALISVADALTLSRGAAVGLGCALAWVVIANRGGLRAFVVPALMVAACAILVVWTQQARLTTALTDKGAVAGANVSHRLDAWRSALELIEANPLAGVGPGNFQFLTAAVDNRPPTRGDATVVHNTYLEVAAEVGLPALALLLAFLVTSFMRLRTVRRRHPGPPSFGVAATAGLIVSVTAALTLSEQYFAPLWMMGAFATCLWQESRDDTEPTRSTVR
jgi:putative inorganic carbon (hco3(-)) transporter